MKQNIKIGLFIAINVIFIIMSLSILVHGLRFKQVSSNSLVTFAILLCLLPMITSPIAIWAILYSKRFHLIIFSAILITTLLVESIISIFLIIYSKDQRGYMDNNLMTIFSRYENSSFVKNLVDEIQINFRCCGFRNFTDWEDVKPHGNCFPQSCCKFPKIMDANQTIFDAPRNLTIGKCVPFEDGCSEVLYQKFSDDYKPFVVNTIIFMILQLICFLYSCFMMHSQ